MSTNDLLSEIRESLAPIAAHLLYPISSERAVSLIRGIDEASREPKTDFRALLVDLVESLNDCGEPWDALVRAREALEPACCCPNYPDVATNACPKHWREVELAS